MKAKSSYSGERESKTEAMDGLERKKGSKNNRGWVFGGVFQILLCCVFYSKPPLFLTHFLVRPSRGGLGAAPCCPHCPRQSAPPPTPPWTQGHPGGRRSSQLLSPKHYSTHRVTDRWTTRETELSKNKTKQKNKTEHKLHPKFFFFFQE